MVVSINGRIFPKEEAKISVFDRGLLYGDSIYETMITFNYRVFRAQRHLSRLHRSAQSLRMPLSWSDGEIFSQIQALSAYTPEMKLRAIVTRGEGDFDLDPTRERPNNVIILGWARGPSPLSWQEEGVSVVVSSVRRNSPQAINPNMKSGNSVNNMMAYGEAKRRGAFDALMLNEKGHLTEATTSNLWIVQGDIIETPPVEEGLLAGITREVLLERAPEASLVIRERPLTLEDLWKASECFLTSTSRFIVPVVKVDGKAIGHGRPGPLAQRVRQLFRREVEEFLQGQESPERFQGNFQENVQGAL